MSERVPRFEEGLARVLRRAHARRACARARSAVETKYGAYAQHGLPGVGAGFTDGVEVGHTGRVLEVRPRLATQSRWNVRLDRSSTAALVEASTRSISRCS